MSITPDTIGPDGPPLSTEGWEAGVREMSSDELRVALRQARKDGAEMRRQRDAERLRGDKFLAERDDARLEAGEVGNKLYRLGKLLDAERTATLEALAERDEALAELEALRAGNPEIVEAAGHIAAAHGALKGWTA